MAMAAMTVIMLIYDDDGDGSEKVGSYATA